MRILLTGASGLVGSAFAREVTACGHHVLGLVGHFPGSVAGLTEQRAINLGDLDALQAVIDGFQPDAVVNAAAVSEPYQCDADPLASERLNVRLPEFLATNAARLGFRLVHLSSEQVFDGTRAPYRVSDLPSPISRYGRQKAESELRVHHAGGPFAVTMRLPLLMGTSATGRRSVHERLFAEWMAGRTPRLFVDEYRQTCTARSASLAALELCMLPQLHGVVHWAGSERTSRHEQGARVRRRFGLPEAAAPLAALSRLDAPELAAGRPADLALDLAPLGNLLKTRPETFEEQLTTLAVPPWAEAWHQQHASP